MGKHLGHRRLSHQQGLREAFPGQAYPLVGPDRDAQGVGEGQRPPGPGLDQRIFGRIGGAESGERQGGYQQGRQHGSFDHAFTPLGPIPSRKTRTMARARSSRGVRETTSSRKILRFSIAEKIMPLKMRAARTGSTELRAPRRS